MPRRNKPIVPPLNWDVAARKLTIIGGRRLLHEVAVARAGMMRCGGTARPAGEGDQRNDGHHRAGYGGPSTERAEM